MHCFLEGDPVLAANDGVDFNTNDLDAVLIQDAGTCQFGAQVQAGLSTEIGQQGIRALSLDDFTYRLQVQRFNIGDISRPRVSHDSGRIGIHQDDFVAQAAQRFARLRSGIIKLAGLPDNYGPGTDNHYLVNIISFGHTDVSYLF